MRTITLALLFCMISMLGCQHDSKPTKAYIIPVTRQPFVPVKKNIQLDLQRKHLDYSENKVSKTEAKDLDAAPEKCCVDIGKPCCVCVKKTKIGTFKVARLTTEISNKHGTTWMVQDFLCLPNGQWINANKMGFILEIIERDGKVLILSHQYLLTWQKDYTFECLAEACQLASFRRFLHQNGIEVRNGENFGGILVLHNEEAQFLPYQQCRTGFVQQCSFNENRVGLSLEAEDGWWGSTVDTKTGEYADKN